MGWDFFNDRSMGKAAVVAELKAGADLGSKYRVVATSVVGGKVWRVVAVVEDVGSRREGDRFFAVDLIRGGGKQMGWGRKDVPYREHDDCPLYMLKMVRAGGEGDELWRAQVREYHAGEAHRAKWLANLKPGDVVSVYGNNYQLLGKSAAKRGWIGRRADGSGPNYRLSKDIKPAVAA